MFGKSIAIEADGSMACCVSTLASRDGLAVAIISESDRIDRASKC